MASKSSDFNRFLEANYPDDWLRFSKPDVKDDVVFAIVSRYEKKYEIWKRIPEWIKNFYGDRLPNELFDGNEPFDRFVEDVERRVLGELEYDYAKLNAHIYRKVMSDDRARLRVSKHMEEGGFTFENSCKLTYQEMKRVDIKKNPNLSDEEKRRLHTESWGETAKIIAEDWKENQVNKWVLHLTKEYDREKIRARRAKENSDEKKAIEHNIKACKKRMEFNKYISKIEDLELRDSYMRLMDDIIEKHIKEEEEAQKTIQEQVKNVINKPHNKEMLKNVNKDVKSVLR